jgi:hypothetical protein
VLDLELLLQSKLVPLKPPEGSYFLPLMQKVSKKNKTVEMSLSKRSIFAARRLGTLRHQSTSPLAATERD